MGTLLDSAVFCCAPNYYCKKKMKSIKKKKKKEHQSALHIRGFNQLQMENRVFEDVEPADREGQLV